MEQKPKIRIDKIVIYREVDTDPDTSWLGEYSDKPGPDDRTVDRVEAGALRPAHVGGEYRYFIAANSGEETGNPNSVKEDFKRMEALNNGQWCFYGIYAHAVVSYDTGHGIRRQESMRSAGLWGIESDSDSEYMASIERDELADLRAHLEAFGVDCSNFAELAAKAEHKEK